MADETRLPLASELDILSARQHVRALAARLGFSSTELTIIATVTSEVARNIVQYAGRGEIITKLVVNGNRRGIVIIASDTGPGIPDTELAMQDGYSTGGGLGLGLPGSRRLMDEFQIVSQVGKGTTVTMKKWARSHG